MSESEQITFEGWHNPVEKQPLLPEQMDQLKTLEKVTVKKDHAELFVGDVLGFDASSLEPKDMIRTGALLGFVRETAQQNRVSAWEVTQAIRSIGVEDPKDIREIEKRYKETIVYVGDVHGGDEDLVKRLEDMAEDPPENLIFEGDLIGTRNFEDLQRLFYNYVNNHSKNELLKNNPDATDEEILSYVGTKPPEDDFNLKKGFEKLRRFELQLAGKTQEEIDEALTNLSDHEIADEIRRYSKYVHYGHYASNLPDEAKQALATGLEENARKILGPVKKMQEKGTKVAMIEGNWDARAPIDFVPDVPTTEPLDPEKRLFRPKKFFEENGVPFYDKVTAFETKTTLQVLMPFDGLVNFPNRTSDEQTELKVKIAEARKQNKTIVVVAHGEPNWQIHNLTVPDAKPTGEHALIVKGFEQALREILPDEVIYGHIHDPLTDEDRNKVDINTKYFMDVMDDGSISLVRDVKDLKPGYVVGSFIPFRRTAEMKVPRKDQNRGIQGVSGNRQPTKVH